MTGPEHYRLAELLLEEAVDYDVTDAQPTLQRAAVHATLALAAAAAYPAVKDYVGDEAGDPRAWTEVLS